MHPVEYINILFGTNSYKGSEFDVFYLRVYRFLFAKASQILCDALPLLKFSKSSINSDDNLIFGADLH